MITTLIVACIVALVWKYKDEERKAHAKIEADLRSRGMM